MRKTPSRACQPKAFTLIELLTVIAIIAILAALLFPAIKSSMLKAEIAQARSDVKNIEGAIRQYYTEYGKLPVQDSDQGAADILYNASNQFQIMNTLRGIAVSGQWNDSNKLNPRRIPFLNVPTRKGAIDSSGNLVDPWGRIYYIKLDNNYDNTILVNPPYGGAQAVTALSLVFSYGPNGVANDPGSTGSDDIVNYR